MKSRLLLFGLMAALALPMMAQKATATKADAMARNDRSQMEEIIPFKVNENAAPTFKMNRGQMLWDFETDDQFNGWLIYDADGDGYNWEVDDYYSCNGGTISLTSRSYYSGALEPDNWLISPEVTLEGDLTIHAMNYSSSWPDVFAVYVFVGGQPETVEDFENFVPISEDIIAPDDWTEYTFDLSEYEGMTGCFAIRHYNCSDKFRILIDYITLGTNEPDPTTPENLEADPLATSATITWDDDDDAMWNLRYRVYNPEAAPSFFEDFENQGVTGDAVAGGWTAVDANGDGYTWYIWDPVSSGYDSGDGIMMFGNKCVTSPSYMGGALNPDNWLISPKVTFDGNLSFWACGQDPSYAEEHFAVFVTTGDPTDLDSYVQVSDEFVAGYPIQEYNVDLSQFAGQEGYVAFRHFNCSDMFRLNLDNVMIGEPGEQAEWIEIDGILEPSIVLTGLDTETTYEVQVQATNGDKSSDWTESTIFTTLDKDPHSAVEEISVATEDNGAYYNIMGQKMDANNLPAGIYIHNGKKVLVK